MKWLWLQLCIGIALWGNPSGAEIAAGHATLSKNGKSLIINTGTDRTIINWKDFSIALGETTRFIQPSEMSAVLNRVISTQSSKIQGLLKSNGNVFLINPNGILIGATGKVDVNGLVASTLDISNAAFLNKEELLFSGDSKEAIENFGAIEARGDDVYLLGRHLVNGGSIVAVRGAAHLGAGSAILVKTDVKRVYIQPDLSDPEGVGVEQKGVIQAGAIDIQADGNLYELAIRHTGRGRALALTEKDGEIYLVADKGEVRVEKEGFLDGDGGNISLLGKTVYLGDKAHVTSKGGEIFVGGSFGGRDPSVLNAEKTVIEPGAFISACASGSGDGGKISVFSTEMTDFRGRLFAQGGAERGDGGLIEVSGIQDLFFRGIVNTMAPNGEDGLLVIDPTNITISGAATAGGTFDGASPLNTFSGTAAAATLNNGDLNTALQTNNVLVTTTSGFGSAGNITVGAATALTLATESHSLELRADNDITLSSSLTMTDTAGGTSTLTLTAGNDILLTSALTGTNLQSISLDADVDILLDNAINASGSTLTIAADNDVISQGGGTNSITAEVCTITAGNDVTITNDITFTGGTTLSVTAAVDFNHNNFMTFHGWDTATLSTTTGDFLVDSGVTASNPSTVTLSAGNDLINQGGTNLFNNTTINATDLNLTATRDVVINSQIDINNFNSCTVTAGRDFDLNSDFEPDNTTTVTVSAGRDIDITNTAADVIANNGTTLSFTAASEYRCSEPFTTTNMDNVNITATSGDVLIGIGTTNSTNVTGANTTINAGTDITITSRVFNTGSGNITLSAGNDVNIGPGISLAQVGTASGTVSVTTIRDLNVVAGATSSDRSQIGFSAASVSSDIELTIGRDINVTGGTNASCVAMIGHGFATVGTYSGDIIFHSVGRDVTLTGGPAGPSSVKFAQIGHARVSTSSATSFTGDIRGSAAGSVAPITGSLTLTGGGDATSYALFGHGGRDSNAIDSYTGEIRVQANDITLTGGTTVDCFAGIGFFAVAQGGGTNPVTIGSSSVVQAISDTTLTMTGSTSGPVSIGVYMLNDVDHPSIANISLVDVQTSGDLTMTAGTAAETDALIGAFSTNSVSSTALTMTVGGDLLINAGTGALAEARVINGTSTTASKNVTINVTGDITPTVAGTPEAFIEATTGNLSVTAGGTITLPDLTHIENAGGSDGTLSVRGGIITATSGGFIRNSGMGTSSITTTSGSLFVGSASFISSVGALTGSIARDVNVLDDASITSSGGTVTMNVSRDINLTGTAAGSAFISSSSSGSYLAGRDINLIGISATEEGFIENTTGTLLVRAGENIEVDTFGRIENLGTGSLTLVVDNDFPTSPGIGPGLFELSATGSVGRLGAGPLRIFTAKRSQNLISGISNVNGTTFTPGTLFVDSATEQWETYFPSSFGGSPFTIFYKDGAAAPLPSTAQLFIATRGFEAFNELFYILDDFGKADPILAWYYPLKVESRLCEEEDEKGGVCTPNAISSTKLPPYIPRYRFWKE